MKYHLVKRFDELLNTYHELLKNSNTTNIDAILKSIKEEKNKLKIDDYN